MRNSDGFTPLGEAKLPQRLEWVAAVPMVNLDVVFLARNEK
jgi:hypothetical protein